MGLHRYNPFDAETEAGAEAADPVTRALAYPFEQKENSFMFTHGEAVDLDEDAIAHGLRAAETEEDWFSGLAAGTGLGEEGMAERIAVVAAGSNSSPRQLKRKFSGLDDEEPVPVLRGVLQDYAVVYAALISSYGAVPATNHYRPGLKANVFVTLLTRAQFRRMNLTEDVGNAYALASLRRGRLHLAGRPAPGLVYGYFALPGALLDEDGALIGLAHVGDQGALRPADQLGVQTVCARHVTGKGDPLPLLKRHLEDAEARRETTRIIQERHALPPSV